MFSCEKCELRVLLDRLRNPNSIDFIQVMDKKDRFAKIAEASQRYWQVEHTGICLRIKEIGLG